MRQLVNDLGIQHDQRTIDVDITTPNRSEEVSWDRGLARRILFNLLNNALKYSSQSVRLGLRCDADMIHVQISDHGIGIVADDQAHVYEPFFRGKNTEFVHGTGIGLFIVQRAVQAMGGTIRFDSELTVGTTFFVDLPRHVTDPDAQSSETLGPVIPTDR
ncbi:MAG: sensor histidine kinase [Chloroflexi bacterium]|nr:sensor histidine kinase [Chloroflexota bacterium]